MMNKRQSSTLIINSLLTNAVVLIAANVLTLYFYASQNSSVWQILLTYYLQTILIVYYYYKRMLQANATQIAHKLRRESLSAKTIALWRENNHEQFLYLLFIVTPLALASFSLGYSFSGKTLFNTIPVDTDGVHVWSVAIASLMFMGHHVVSYYIDLWEYNKGKIKEITLPMSRIVIRVYTLLGVVVLLSMQSIYSDNGPIFYAFIMIKTFVDILFSGTVFLLFRRSQ